MSARDASGTGAALSLDQEIRFLQLRALHLVPHPDRQHSTTSPFVPGIFLRPIFRLGLSSRAGPWSPALRSCQSITSSSPVDSEVCGLTLEVLALFFDLRRKCVSQACD